MLLLPIVSRIGFPCEQAIEQGSKGADFPETRGLLPSFVSRIRFRCKQWKEQWKPSPKCSRNPGLLPPDGFENWLFLNAGKEQVKNGGDRLETRASAEGAPATHKNWLISDENLARN